MHLRRAEGDGTDHAGDGGGGGRNRPAAAAAAAAEELVLRPDDEAVVEPVDDGGGAVQREQERRDQQHRDGHEPGDDRGVGDLRAYAQADAEPIAAINVRQSALSPRAAHRSGDKE